MCVQCCTQIGSFFNILFPESKRAIMYSYPFSALVGQDDMKYWR